VTVRLAAAPQAGHVLVEYETPAGDRDVRAPMSAMEHALVAEIQRLTDVSAATAARAASAFERLEHVEADLMAAGQRAEVEVALAALAADCYQLCLERVCDAWEELRASEGYEARSDARDRISRLIVDCREVLAVDHEGEARVRLIDAGQPVDLVGG
jgi:hypothetical protein